MLSGIYNFTCEQGATFAKLLTFRLGNGELCDFTGYTARMYVKKDTKSADLLIELTTENGRLSLGGEEGTIEFYISAEDTASIPRSGIYDLEVDSGENTYRILKGRFQLDPEVTV